jgi:hypothetical protein
MADNYYTWQVPIDDPDSLEIMKYGPSQYEIDAALKAFKKQKEYMKKRQPISNLRIQLKNGVWLGDIYDISVYKQTTSWIFFYRAGEQDKYAAGFKVEELDLGKMKSQLAKLERID